MFPLTPPRLNLAQRPTPFHQLKRFSAFIGGPRIWVKRDDLTGSILSGNKVRKLEFVLAEAQAAQAQVIITAGGVQSNHCRATAYACASLGLECHLILREEPTGAIDGNLLLDKLTYAKISTFPKAGFGKALKSRFEAFSDDYKAKGKRAFCIPIGASDGIGLWGYIEAARELAHDFSKHHITKPHVFCATGSGGTQAGLSLGLSVFCPQAKVSGVAVCDSKAYFAAKAKEDLNSWRQRYSPNFDCSKVTIETLDNHIGEGYGLADQSVFDTIKQMASLEGLVLDPVYTAKAMNGLIQEVKSGRYAPDDDIVFIHTGGIFGLYPYKDALFSH